MTFVRREASANAGPLDALFRPRSIAVVGASTREDAIGFRVIRNLRRIGFTGEIFPINPRYKEVAGLPCLPSIGALPAGIDAAFIAIPAEQGPAVLDEIGQRGIRAAFVNASGYADGGAEGRALQQRLETVARAHGIALCGPNNMGLINVHDRVAPWTQFHMTAVHPGPVAVISQSGSIALVLAQDERNLGLSYLVTAGNEAILTVADYLDHIVRDDRVRTILLFLESIRDPQRFAMASREAHRRGKRIVALKTGASERGQALAAAHTDSLAGDNAVYDAFFRDNSVVRVRDLDEMIETAVLMTAYPTPPRERHFVPITLSGGEAALIADLADQVGLDLKPLAGLTVERLRPAFPPFGRPNNPLDGWGLGFNVQRFGEILAALHADPDIGAIGLAIDSPASGGGDTIYALEMAKLAEPIARGGRPVVFFNNTVGGGPNPDVRAILGRAGIPYLSGMRPALAAVAHWFRVAEPRVAPDIPQAAQDWRRRLGTGATLGELDAQKLLREAGVPMVESRAVGSAEDAIACAAEWGGPIVLKGSAPNLLHKTELDLVRVRLESPEAIRKTYDDLARRLRRHTRADSPGAIIAQPMLQGVELIVGVRSDPAFGSIVVVGLGGIFVELLKDVMVRVGPVDPGTARAMLEQTRAHDLLRGFRGKGPYDIASAAEAIAALSRFGAATQDLIGSIEINPLIVLEHGAFGVDLVITPADKNAPDRNS